MDTDCPGGYHCRNGDCVYDCTVDAECPEGYRCTARGRCEAGCVKTNGGVEICDWVDNDCDGETDEGLLNRCGECEPPDDELVELCGDGVDNDCDGETDEGFDRVGQPCQNQGCSGTWVCTPDRLGEECNAPAPAADDAVCDGVDEDCDGLTDEDASEQACPLQQGVCAGVMTSCQDGQWSPCDYGPHYTEGTDDICDLQDNDCDGAIDEDAAMVLQGEFGPAATDGLDNNCNGIIDEPGGVMVRVPYLPSVAVDVFETTVFDGPACDGTRYGDGVDDYPPGWPAEGVASEMLYACSLPGVRPSGHLSWYRARRACEAQGKRLCKVSEWTNSCSGVAGRLYPYGSAFVPGLCNDAWQFDGGAGTELAPCGAYQDCLSESGTYDMSGNLAEWVQELDPDHPDCAWTGGWAYRCELCEFGFYCRSCSADDEDDQEDIRIMSNCMIFSDWEATFPRNQARAHLGTRCCMDIP